MTRVLAVKEGIKKEKKKKLKLDKSFREPKKVPKKVRKPISKKKRVLFAGLIVGAIGIAIAFGSGWLGSLFNPELGGHSTGWADLEVFYFNDEYKVKDFGKDEVMIDVYYIENGSLYLEDLTLDDFPLYISSPSCVLIRDHGEIYEYRYVQLLGNPNKDEPCPNEVFLYKAADPSLIELDATILNITYLDYSNPDPLNQILTQYEISSGEIISGDFEVSSITCVSKANLLDSEYFCFDVVGLDEQIEKHYVWIDTSGSAVDPDVLGRIGHKVDISSISDANQVALEIASVVNGIDHVSASAGGSVITIVNDNEGAVKDCFDHIENTGFIVSTVSQGEFPWHNDLQFGDRYSFLNISISGIEAPYFWGCGTYIPPDEFEDAEALHPIAFLNDFDWKGLMLGFDAEINVSFLEYSAEGNFFHDVNVYEVDLNEDPVPEKLWVVLVPDQSVGGNVQYRFEASSKGDLNTIYMWSGWLDDFQDSALSFTFNQYQKINS